MQRHMLAYAISLVAANTPVAMAMPLAAKHQTTTQALAVQLHRYINNTSAHDSEYSVTYCHPFH
jgi:hypothetical protein